MNIEITEFSPSESVEEAMVDWSVLDVEGVREAAEKAARRVARQYDRLEFEDLRQEAYLALAAHAGQMRAALAEGGLGRLHHAVWCDLTNLAAKETRRLERNTSYEANQATYAEAV
ncbi:hypothetical protein [Streptomyces sp. NBC_01198]|uniref:hypothetical protein n=1 Tax=Streptomyces sp. NBC_01198 TaxID=2903769 RepID=UPI002E160E4A|nr:hypothetical protein OG702_31870 [Streptomyces sp. NBC_01198]